ncbi:arginine biosynthesis bifunctional protein argj, chloroplastic [Nicotiana attenuata]|uniref:Arginine biosynthesis bifunctional protein argj, chloroplastic n=1 Tax=Nicotiana attenuata TaxID=49451 RepID=A0A1J6KHI2_NICAT|nr:arginine biosynthesis bifunctional protein argj, chloroplastic [Nicotiana attenuata]
MSLSVPHFISVRFSDLNGFKVQVRGLPKHLRRDFKVLAVTSMSKEASNYIPAAPIFLPEGPWQQVRDFYTSIQTSGYLILLYSGSFHSDTKLGVLYC